MGSGTATTWMRAVLLAGAIGFAVPSAARAATIDIEATDASTGYDVSTGKIETNADGLAATVVQPNTGALFQGKLNWTLQLDTVESPVTIGTRFVGGNASSADVWITDVTGTTVLLALEVNEIFVSNIVPGFAGSFATSLNLGGIDPDVSSGQSSVTITGGTLAGDFGGIGTDGLMFVLMDTPTKNFFPGAVFNSSFSAQSNTQFHFLPVPEPGAGLLIGSALLALAVRERRHRG
ncbi:MAG: hypothetical protein R3E88_06750 [Myxococcota bacterium]|nr:hypothetical protein [Myxococcales bacterium]